jgi:hypothetical protein
VSPDTLRAFLRRVARRLRGIAALRGLTIAFAIAALLVVFRVVDVDPIGRAVLVGVAAAIAGVVAGAMTGPRGARRTAALVERHVPGSKNLVLTATELIERPSVVKPYIGERISRDAARFVGGVDVARAFPARRELIGLGTAGLLWLAAVVAVKTAAPGADVTPRPSSASAAAISAIEIVVTPPTYTGLPSRTLTDPARVEAIQGSQLRVAVTADAQAVSLETVSATHALGSTAARRFETEVLADADGFLAIEPTATTGERGTRRLIGLVVTPDRLPQVKIVTPGRDLLLPNTRQTLDIALDATDDLALSALSVKYTKVTGSGENFTFTTGEVPLSLTRTNDATWSGRGALALASLKLEAGDMVIYRGVASDRRPGAPAAESDTFIVEIAAPGAVAMEGFAVDDRMDRYAISQQMVIVNTERLIARRSSMTEDAFKDEIAGIASEQRQVRAEFVFMMGGELADAGLDPTVLNEEHEAESESELAEGRLVNRGRADLIRAIRYMSRAASLLHDENPTRALTEEKSALKYLQSAFSRTRYILRTLGERERLDLSRRLTGVLGALSRDRRPAAEPDPSPRAAALRHALAGVAAIDPRGGQAAATAAADVAQRVLRLDPSAPPLRDIADLVSAAGVHISAGADAPVIARDLDRAAIGLAALIRIELTPQSSRFPSRGAAELEGAIADALRGRAPGR